MDNKLQIDFQSNLFWCPTFTTRLDVTLAVSLYLILGHPDSSLSNNRTGFGRSGIPVMVLVYFSVIFFTSHLFTHSYSKCNTHIFKVWTSVQKNMTTNKIVNGREQQLSSTHQSVSRSAITPASASQSSLEAVVYSRPSLHRHTKYQLISILIMQRAANCSSYTFII